MATRRYEDQGEERNRTHGRRCREKSELKQLVTAKKFAASVAKSGRTWLDMSFATATFFGGGWAADRPERWLSGRKHFIANEATGSNWSAGSNPVLSAAKPWFPQGFCISGQLLWLPCTSTPASAASSCALPCPPCESIESPRNLRFLRENRWFFSGGGGIRTKGKQVET